jgi:hypothetical protein
VAQTEHQTHYFTTSPFHFLWEHKRMKRKSIPALVMVALRAYKVGMRVPPPASLAT